MSLTTQGTPIRHRFADGGTLVKVFVAGLCVLFLVVLLLPPLLVPAGLTPNETVTATNNVRTSLIQVFGGIALLIGALFTARTYLLSRHSNRVDRFAKAAGSLGDASLSVRTGGILSLQHLASESDEYWPLVEEMLAVFIREHARHVDQPRPGRALSRGPSKYRRRQPSGPSQPIEEQQTPASPSSDVRVALRVLGKRPRPAPGTRRNPVDLSHLDLSEVDLQGANLDSVRFDGSILRGAQLSDASLNSVSLKGARLERAELSSADLSYADLQKASVTDAVFYEALMTGTKVWGCDLASMNLSDIQQKAVDLSDYRSGPDT